MEQLPKCQLLLRRGVASMGVMVVVVTVWISWPIPRPYSYPRPQMVLQPSQHPQAQPHLSTRTPSQPRVNPMTEVGYQVLDSRCYKYHPNLTAENTCCKMLNFTNSLDLIHTCIHTQNRKSSAGVHWMIFGDSHMRYLLAALVTRFNSSMLQYRLRMQEWKNGNILEHTLRNAYQMMHESIEVRDLSINFHLTFFWDIYFTILPTKMTLWETKPEEMPAIVIFSGALWWMLKTQDLYTKKGAKAAVAEYEAHLRSMRSQLSLLTTRTTFIFKLLDDLRRARANSTSAIDTRSNYPLYNSVATQVLSGTGVLLWNSTLPMSEAYTNVCIAHPRETPPRNLWKCGDPGHVGYILVEQYADMIINHVCNQHFDLGPGYCSIFQNM